jgi:hypothetical protein
MIKLYKNYKEDHREPIGGWCDGDYLNTCLICNCGFIGDKRAYHCADCEYAKLENSLNPRIILSKDKT